MVNMKRLNSKYLHTGKAWIKNAALIINPEGKFEAVLSQNDADQHFSQAEVIAPEKDVILPGCVNTHSHAFQLLLRPTTGQPMHFKDWVDRFLYPLVLTLDEESLYTSAKVLFQEMLSWGITTIGEFFYVQNTPDFSSSKGKNAQAVIQAAKDVGLRMVMIRTLYDQVNKPGQKRFYESKEEALNGLESLYQLYKDDPAVTVIPAPHSLHGASQELIISAASWAKNKGCKMHIHLSEQASDIPYAQEKYGTRPVKALSDWGVLNDHLVLVHGIWLDEDEKKRLGASGGGLAYNPVTNMALGDGIADIQGLMTQGVTVSLGTDANIQGNLFAECRSVEYLQRTEALKMGVLNAHDDLFPMLNVNGGINLGIEVGQIAPGYWADFIALDGSSASLYPAFDTPEPEPIINQIIFSMQREAIESVFVGGQKVQIKA